MITNAERETNIEITLEMIAAGLNELPFSVLEEPAVREESLVSAIYRAMETVRRNNG